MQHAGIQVQGGFIVGFDSDPPSIFRRQMEFIQRTGIVAAMVGLLQAPHGTRLNERLKGEGRILGELSGDNVSGLRTSCPRWASASCGLAIAGYWTSSIPPRITTACGALLKEYHPRRSELTWTWTMCSPCFAHIPPGHCWGRARALLASVFWTLLHRPRLFSTAITLAIYGYHFRTVSEQHVCSATGTGGFGASGSAGPPEPWTISLQ